MRRDGGLGATLAPLDEAADDLPAQPRRFVPEPGSLPEDGEVDLDRIAALLPESVLRHIALFHREANTSMRAARAAAAEEEEEERNAQQRARKKGDSAP